jgi:Ca-activated chloride channel family protein
VVTFGSWVEVIVPTTLATAEAQRKATRKIRDICTGSDTDLYEGWSKTCSELAPTLHPLAVGRVIVVTDGQANRGKTDVAEIAASVQRQQRQRIVTSTIGVGQDFDEQLLGRMADAGGGHFYYAEHNHQLPKALDNEIGEAMTVVSRQAELVLAVPAGAQVASLNELPIEPALGGRRFILKLGDLIAQQQLALVIKVKLPPGRAGTRCALQIEITDADQNVRAQPLTVQWSWAHEAENNAQERALPVTRAAAKLFAAQARQVALALNKKDHCQAAEQHLLRVARNNRRVAGSDPEQLAVVAELENAAALMRTPLDDETSKSMFSHGYMALKGRDELGRALRAAMEESTPPA